MDTTKKLNNKTILGLNNIVCIAMWSLVLYSNCFVIYYRLMLRGSIKYILLYHYTETK